MMGPDGADQVHLFQRWIKGGGREVPSAVIPNT